MALEQRLSELRERGGPGPSSLWIEALPPDEALGELCGREGGLFRLQEAFFLIQVGRQEEARDILKSLAELPPGLKPARDDLLARVEPTKARVESKEEGALAGEIATKTLAELYVSQGDTESAVATYREVLNREPGDDEARARLRQLLENQPPTEAISLPEMLEHVRLWRRALGV